MSYAIETPTDPKWYFLVITAVAIVIALAFAYWLWVVLK